MTNKLPNSRKSNFATEPDIVLERYAPGTMRRSLEAIHGLFERWKGEEEAHRRRVWRGPGCDASSMFTWSENGLPRRLLLVNAAVPCFHAAGWGVMLVTALGDKVVYPLARISPSGRTTSGGPMRWSHMYS